MLPLTRHPNNSVRGQLLPARRTDCSLDRVTSQIECITCLHANGRVMNLGKMTQTVPSRSTSGISNRAGVSPPAPAAPQTCSWRHYQAEASSSRAPLIEETPCRCQFGRLSERWCGGNPKVFVGDLRAVTPVLQMCLMESPFNP